MAKTDTLTYDSTNKKRTKSVTQTELTKTYNFNTKGKYNDSDIGLTVNVDLAPLTSDATAGAKQIIMGRTAYSGGKISGKMPIISNISINASSMSVGSTVTNTSWADLTYTLTSLIDDVPTNIDSYVYSAFEDSTTKIDFSITNSNLAASIGLTADKILKGNTILGTVGTATSDATATAANIAKGKTAYVNGKKITGTYVASSTSTSAGTSVTALYKGTTSTLAAFSSLGNQPGYLNLNNLTGKLIKSSDGKIFIYPYRLTSTTQDRYGYLYKIIILNLTSASVSMSNYSSTAFACTAY